MSLSKPRLIIHIGQHKTGSKALQSFLAHNRRALRARGILYPAGDHPCAGIPAYAISQYRLYALIRREAIQDCFGEDTANDYWRQQSQFCTPFDSSRSFFEALDSELRRSRLDRLVVSAEDLFDMHTAHELRFFPQLIRAGARRLAALASDFDYEVTVMAYLRRQDHLLGAHYVQFVKGGPIHDVEFEPFVRAFAPRLDTYRILAQWAVAFGRDRLLVRRYEPSALPGGIVPDFFEHVLRLSVPTDAVQPPLNAETVNRTLDRDFVEFIRLLNRRALAGQPVFTRDAVLATALRAGTPAQGSAGISAWLSPAARRNLLHACQDGNAVIAREFLRRADGRLFDEPWPEESGPWEPYPGLSPERAGSIALAIQQTIVARGVLAGRSDSGPERALNHSASSSM